ncbi:TetR/AcrR family transcriptional regulator [Streptomyces sp. NPDC047002]|uniref:TetR/AcrR family transcriptional regulator n=1 Tax=Streptomyces sp. NPDC047002 TaxID=3155475 RepID=UPI003455D45B
MDARRTVDLLFARAGERRGLTVPRIVAAAVGIADADGLDALSMRRLAERLGFTTMALYRHVPGRAELVELMRDAAFAGLPAWERQEPREDWRAGLEAWAVAHWELHLRHPWLAATDGSRRLPGPHVLADYDHALGCAERTGLPPAQAAAVVDLLAGFVLSAARRVHDVLQAERASGVSHTRWWHGQDRLVGHMASYPAIARLGVSGAFDAPEDPFDFGLARTLDGVAALVAATSRDGNAASFRNADDSADGGCAVCGAPVPAAPRGRPRRYCSPACRQRAYRGRSGA